jgi:hypothetical protein
VRVESRESRVESLESRECGARVISEEGPIIIGNYH